MAEPLDKNWDPETIQIGHDAFSGLTVVITGKLQSMERMEAELLVERAGGNATGSISSKTDLLIAGDKAGSKLKKAADLGVEVINEAEFIKRLGLILP
jgi:DNA ligase (NAD+)